MTVAEATLAATEAGAPARAASGSSGKKWLLFGTGLGIAAGARNLDWAVVRTRPSGSRLVASGSIADFRSRPAAEWGEEFRRLMRASGEKHLNATLLLPRAEVIVRTLHLPGVAGRDLPAAIGLQADTLHPWGDDEVLWAWERAGGDSVLVGLVRKALLEQYETLFSEAGIGMAAVSFSAAVIHAALRMRDTVPASLLCSTGGDAAAKTPTEVYGESEARAVYSAEFSFAPERALAIARAELRLPADHAASTLAEALKAPESAELSATGYAAALAASAPLANRFANLLPKERRASSARQQYLLPAILAFAAAVAAVLCFWVLPGLEERRYLKSLNDEIQRLEPSALRARALEKGIAQSNAKIATLDDFRRRTQADLDVMNELTRLLQPPVWTNSIEIYPDSVVIAGEADQASALLKLLDSSPLFQNSEFAVSVTRSGTSEQFRIRTMRRGRVGRTTP